MWNWLRKAANPDLEVLDEIDSFLEGNLPQHAGGRAARMPGWVWISAVAHGDPEVLAAVATRPEVNGVVGSWERAIGFLGGEVLDVADRREASVRDLQQRVLIPAELHFLDQAARGWSPGPAEFASDVLAQLEEHRRAGPRRESS